LTNVWPSVKAGAPKAHLRIAGSVSAKLGAPPKGVSLLGVVPDLKPLYEGAGIVISPLLAGSGLKIKLIEALSYGKAIVCTTPTIQGVGAIVNNAVTVADDAEHFTSAILNLLLNKGLRERQATLALEVARRHFSAEACYRHFLSAVGEARRSEPQRSSAFMA
jgi:succinoglycan biosynthesis protein ExoO